MAITVDMLRSYIKDTPMMNKIFAGIEFQDRDYASAIYWGDERVHSVPPFISGFTPDMVPNDIMRLAALAALFEMAALYNLRNVSNLSEEGVPVPVGENGIIYERLAEKYEGKFETKLMRFKTAKNMEAGITYQRGPYSRYANSGVSRPGEIDNI